MGEVKEVARRYKREGFWRIFGDRVVWECVKHQGVATDSMFGCPVCCREWVNEYHAAERAKRIQEQAEAVALGIRMAAKDTPHG